MANSKWLFFSKDFEVWDDVGLNIPKPPELLHLYRDSMRNSHILDATLQSTSTQTDYCVEEVELLVRSLPNIISITLFQIHIFLLFVNLDLPARQIKRSN